MKCDRCGKSDTGLSMSMFNVEMICETCDAIERKHPDFENAYEAELTQVKMGNYNFSGIGKPDDL